MTKRDVLVFVAGVATGGIIVMLLGAVMAFMLFHFPFKNTDESNEARNKAHIEMFDKPQQKIDIETILVLQVLANGDAMTKGLGNNSCEMFLPKEEGKDYYDGMEIVLSSTQEVRHVGTYRFEDRGEYRTIPIVKIFDK